MDKPRIANLSRLAHTNKKASAADPKVIPFRSIADERGNLVPVTAEKEVPFRIARVFFVYGIPAGSDRGGHAHIECQQLLVSLNGTCEVTLDDGESRTTHTLRTPCEGLYVPPGIWCVQHFDKPESVLLVFTDQAFRESDYIRNYQAFLDFRGVSSKKAMNG